MKPSRRWMLGAGAVGAAALATGSIVLLNQDGEKPRKLEPSNDLAIKTSKPEKKGYAGRVEQFVRSLGEWAPELVTDDFDDYQSDKILRAIHLSLSDEVADRFDSETRYLKRKLKYADDDVMAHNLGHEVLKEVVGRDGYKGPSTLDIHDHFEAISDHDSYRAMAEKVEATYGYVLLLKELGWLGFGKRDLRSNQSLAVDQKNENGDDRGLELLRTYRQLQERRDKLLGEDYTKLGKSDFADRRAEISKLLKDMSGSIKEFGGWKSSIPKNYGNDDMGRLLQALDKFGDRVAKMNQGFAGSLPKFSGREKKSVGQLLYDTREMFANYVEAMFSLRLSPFMWYQPPGKDTRDLFRSIVYKGQPLLDKQLQKYELGLKLAAANHAKDVPSLRYAVEVDWAGNKRSFPENSYTLKVPARFWDKTADEIQKMRDKK